MSQTDPTPLDHWKLKQARRDADRATETKLVGDVHAAYLATAQSSLDRALTRMNVVTAAVGTIMSVYTGLLAYVYSADPKKGQPQSLDIVALYPAIFLGLSLFLVTIYAAMFRSKREVRTLLPTSTDGLMVEQRLVAYMTWCFSGVLARRWALHAGIVSMGFGVATLPVVFIETDDFNANWLFAAGLFAVAATGIWTWARSYEI